MISGGCNIWDIWDLPYLVQEDICYVRGGVEEEEPPVLSLQFNSTLGCIFGDDRHCGFSGLLTL